ncbi:MAG TPA: hypothetical protein VF776_00115 [Sphingomicrobium sp.]
MLFYSSRLFVRAQINGVPTEALLDSAAEASLVDPEARPIWQKGALLEMMNG